MTMHPDCERGRHLPLTDRERYDAAGPEWADLGTCPRCRSTVRVPREVEAARMQMEGGEIQPVASLLRRLGFGEIEYTQERAPAEQG